jgi:hypothetical protein
VRLEFLSVRRCAWALVGGLALAACSPLRMTPPETGAGGSMTGMSGAAGATGDAGTTGTGGTTGDAGRGGTTATAGTGGLATAGTAGGGRGGTGAAGGSEPAGLIAHWRFDEGMGTTAADLSGNNQTMTLSANGASWAAAGHQGRAALFDGVNGYAEMTPQAGQALSNYPVIKLTFSAWVRPDVGVASRDYATAVARAHEDYRFEDFWIGLVDGSPGCIIHDEGWGGAVATAVAAPGVWTHIACTYAMTGQVVLYVNGAFAASTTSNQTIGPIPPRILVGAAEAIGASGSSVLQAFFPGAVDDVRIYNETLTPSEVASIAR